MLKDELIKLAESYEELRKHVLKIVDEILPKIKDISDAQLIHSLKEKVFYWKHDLPAVILLAEKYKISLAELNKTFEKYSLLEESINKKKKHFEKIGLNHISLSPHSISATADNDTLVEMAVNLKSKNVEIKIYPEDNESGWTEEFRKHADGLKVKIEKLLSSN